MSASEEGIFSGTEPEAEYEPLGVERRLSPQEIRHSAFANRALFNWQSREFQNLKAEIAEGGGNRVPILVRPLDSDPQYKYEIVYGHRRHQACLDLGLEVLALSRKMSDLELVLHMAVENRQRKDLCPYERGVQYQRVLDLGHYKSLRDLAGALGLPEHSGIAKYIRLAQLPKDIVRAFKSEGDIQVNWAPDLHAAFEMDPMAVIEQANLLSAEGRTADAKFVYERLCGAPRKKAAPADDRTVVVEHQGQRIATLVMPSRRSRKGITAHLEPGFKDVGQLEAALRACWSEEITGAADTHSSHARNAGDLKVASSM